MGCQETCLDIFNALVITLVLLSLRPIAYTYFYVLYPLSYPLRFLKTWYERVQDHHQHLHQLEHGEDHNAGQEEGVQTWWGAVRHGASDACHATFLFIVQPPLPAWCGCPRWTRPPPRPMHVIQGYCGQHQAEDMSVFPPVQHSAMTGMTETTTEPAAAAAPSIVLPRAAGSGSGSTSGASTLRDGKSPGQPHRRLEDSVEPPPPPPGSPSQRRHRRRTSIAYLNADDLPSIGALSPTPLSPPPRSPSHQGRRRGSFTVDDFLTAAAHVAHAQRQAQSTASAPPTTTLGEHHEQAHSRSRRTRSPSPLGRDDPHHQPHHGRPRSQSRGRSVSQARYRHQHFVTSRSIQRLLDRVQSPSFQAYVQQQQQYASHIGAANSNCNPRHSGDDSNSIPSTSRDDSDIEHHGDDNSNSIAGRAAGMLSLPAAVAPRRFLFHRSVLQALVGNAAQRLGSITPAAWAGASNSIDVQQPPRSTTIPPAAAIVSSPIVPTLQDDVAKDDDAATLRYRGQTAMVSPPPQVAPVPPAEQMTLPPLQQPSQPQLSTAKLPAVDGLLPLLTTTAAYTTPPMSSGLTTTTTMTTEKGKLYHYLFPTDVPSIFFGGSGFLFGFYLGIVAYIQRHFRTSGIQCIALSSGVFAGLALCCGLDAVDMVLHIWPTIQRHYCGRNTTTVCCLASPHAGATKAWRAQQHAAAPSSLDGSPSDAAAVAAAADDDGEPDLKDQCVLFDSHSTLYEVFDKLLPDDAHIRCSGRLFMLLTTFPAYKNITVCEYSSKHQLINCTLASICLPLLLFRDLPWIDPIPIHDLARVHGAASGAQEYYEGYAIDGAMSMPWITDKDIVRLTTTLTVTDNTVDVAAPPLAPSSAVESSSQPEQPVSPVEAGPQATTSGNTSNGEDATSPQTSTQDDGLPDSVPIVPDNVILTQTVHPQQFTETTVIPSTTICCSVMDLQQQLLPVTISYVATQMLDVVSMDRIQDYLAAGFRDTGLPQYRYLFEQPTWRAIRRDHPEQQQQQQ